MHQVVYGQNTCSPANTSPVCVSMNWTCICGSSPLPRRLTDVPPNHGPLVGSTLVMVGPRNQNMSFGVTSLVKPSMVMRTSSPPQPGGTVTVQDVTSHEKVSTLDLPIMMRMALGT